VPLGQFLGTASEHTRLGPADTRDFPAAQSLKVRRKLPRQQQRLIRRQCVHRSDVHPARARSFHPDGCLARPNPARRHAE